MKQKLLATIIVLILFAGIFATSFNFRPTAEADIMYHLDVYTDPSIIPVNGTGDYTDETWVELDALDEWIVGDTKYVMDYWDIDGSGSYSDPVYVYMDADKNATAHYKTQYKLTVDVGGCGTPKIFVTGWEAVSEKWVDANTYAWAGAFDLLCCIGGTYGVYLCPNQWQGFVNWTGPGISGAVHYADTPPYHWMQSNPINMTGPKTAVANWVYIYKLFVYSDPASAPGLPSTGWYEYCTNVTLTAPKVPWINPNKARWLFQHWAVEDPSMVVDCYNETVVIHIEKNNTATAFYRRQSWLKLADNIANQSGFADTGKWYYNCENVTFSVPKTINLGGGVRYQFRYWELVTACKYFGTGQNTITLHINSTHDGETLKARYQTQYLLRLRSDPTSIYSKSKWYDAGISIPAGTYTAPDLEVIVPDESRYKFYQWVRTDPPGWSGVVEANSLPVIAMSQPKTFVANYNLEYKREWSHDPLTLTVPGFPGFDWQKNGTTLNWQAPLTDTSGVFQLHYWTIDGVTYPEGQATVPITHDHFITGTAYYANKTKLYMSPDRVDMTAHAWCTKFDVTITAANFDADRKHPTTGRPLDIYGFDIIVDFDPTLLRITGVSLNLDAFFAPNAYFIAINKIDNAAGTYQLVATVKGNYTGFEGTKAIFTIEFHVKYDPCYPNWKDDWIKFSYARLINHLDEIISPELGYKNCYYKIVTVKPILEIRDASDGDNSIVVHSNNPQTIFDVEVWLLHGVKVHDFYVIVDYDETQIEAFDVIIATYLKPPYTVYQWSISKGAGKVTVKVAQDPSVPLQNCSGLLFTIKFKVIDQIFHTIPGPHYLTSDITIESAYLSVMCPTPFLQWFTTHLGSIKATYTYNPQPGDLDFDGCVTILDLQLIADNYGPTAIYDITGDGKTDIRDLVYVALRFSTCI